MTDLAICCKNLVKHYPGGVQAVRGLNLEVKAGECFGLLGPNGAGKTTTIEILEGLLPPTSGEVSVLGRQWGRSDRELRARLGISLQETRLSERLTVMETLRLFRSFYPRGLDAREGIDLVALGEKSEARVGKLSSGQRQRLAVACALIGDPELLFLDEPTAGLDPQSRRQIWDLLHHFSSRGRTILITTHYMDEAEKLCDRVAVIDHGEVIAEGPPPELIATLGGDHVIELALTNGAPPADEPAAGRQVRLLGESLKGMNGVSSVHVEGREMALAVSEPHVILPVLLRKVQDSGSELSRLSIRHASLEDVFVRLTGRHLRDGELPRT